MIGRYDTAAVYSFLARPGRVLGFVFPLAAVVDFGNNEVRHVRLPLGEYRLTHNGVEVAQICSKTNGE